MCRILELDDVCNQRLVVCLISANPGKHVKNSASALLRDLGPFPVGVCMVCECVYVCMYVCTYVCVSILLRDVGPFPVGVCVVCVCVYVFVCGLWGCLGPLPSRVCFMYVCVVCMHINIYTSIYAYV
jgi:hypothetical protein